MARRVIRSSVAISRRYEREALICPREPGSMRTRQRLAGISLGMVSPLPKPLRTTTTHVGPDAFVRAAERSSADFFLSLDPQLLDGADECVRTYVSLGNPYFPASSFFTASLTAFPSTRIPAAAKRAMAAFITVPISFMAGAGVISAIAARTPATISSSPAAFGR